MAGGTPTLTLNDGGTATYTGGSGGTALTFSYTVAAGQNTADLSVTAVNLNGATVKDGAGNSRQPLRDPVSSRHPADRHHGAHGGVGGDLRDRHHQRQRRSQGRQRGHADAHHERGGDGGGRHADADAQRWRHGDLHRRLGQHGADLQLYGGRRAEHRRPVGERGQSQRRHHQGWGREQRQPLRDPVSSRHAADRHHGAHGGVGGDLRDRHHQRQRRPQGRQRRSR